MGIKALTGISAMMMLLGGSAVSAQSVANESFRVHVSVPVVCTVSHRATMSSQGNGYILGDLREYCNAPNGYLLAVDYAPGSMKGAVVSVGDERVVLDGSGHTIISRAAGPRIRDRQIFATPGAKGFDTDQLVFNVQAS